MNATILMIAILANPYINELWDSRANDALINGSKTNSCQQRIEYAYALHHPLSKSRDALFSQKDKCTFTRKMAWKGKDDELYIITYSYENCELQATAINKITPNSLIIGKQLTVIYSEDCYVIINDPLNIIALEKK